MKHRMSRLQRAKQFMPFAALRGFEALLATVAKPKENTGRVIRGSNRRVKYSFTICTLWGVGTNRLLQQTKIYGTYRSC